MRILISRGVLTLYPEFSAETCQLEMIAKECDTLGVKVEVERQWEPKSLTFRLEREPVIPKI